jgi:L-alanine-DL-glutamate epimerase-like enolase superfamily enzyme
MKIEAADFFYLSMPEVTTEGNGSQDALLVRVAAGGHVGWGECEASPRRGPRRWSARAAPG